MFMYMECQKCHKEAGTIIWNTDYYICQDCFDELIHDDDVINDSWDEVLEEE